MKVYRGKIPFLLTEYKENIVYICSSNRNIEDYYHVLQDIYSGNILRLESSSNLEELEINNYELLDILNSKKKYIILVSLEGYLRDYFLTGKKYEIKVGEVLDLKKLIEDLDQNGYERSYLVEERNQYSVRGDIIDIFPKDGINPIRIELSFDDEIDRIADFDIETQKSIARKNRMNMYINSNKDETSDFFSLIKKQKDTKFFVENMDLLDYKLEELIEREGKERELLYNRYNRLLRDKRISKSLKILVGFTVTYLLSPWDFFSKKDGMFSSIFSKIDDGLLLIFTLSKIFTSIDINILKSHFEGDEEILNFLIDMFDVLYEFLGIDRINKIYAVVEKFVR